MDYVFSVLRAIGLFVVGLVAFRIMGSQAVGRLTDFDLVVVIAIGAIIGDGLADPELNPFILIAAIAGLVLMQLLASVLAMKSNFIEKLVIGSPIKLIENGKILMSGLRRARITKNNLDQELRVKGLTSFEQIEQAFMEPNGKLSVIEKTN
ncbi:MAG TPA: YetF domain-containing protein [Candidatus Udaeobacter sp.]|nr:YetF domain-containing protein [Candidatus Udaeobacter sp.]